MVHAATTIQLAEGSYLQIGFLMCFSDPTITISHVRKNTGERPEIEGAVSFAPAYLDVAIAALQKVRDALPKTG